MILTGGIWSEAPFFAVFYFMEYFYHGASSILDIKIFAARNEFLNLLFEFFTGRK
jgi:hypothetical protein